MSESNAEGTVGSVASVNGDGCLRVLALASPGHWIKLHCIGDKVLLLVIRGGGRAARPRPRRGGPVQARPRPGQWWGRTPGQRR